MRKLIFNADDYGLSPGVSAGIRDAHAGVVHSTTVMANLVEPGDVAALAASGMSAGVHLNLSCGPPLSTGYPASLLKPDGSFDKALALDPGTWEEGNHRAAVVAEWSAQLDRLASLGLTVDHVDSHHHTHMIDSLFPLALDFAVHHGLALRTRTDQRPVAAKAGVATPAGFVESYFGNNNVSRAWLLAVLGGTTGDVVEVMCHPGRVDDGLTRLSGYRSERETELYVLSDKGLAAELEVLGWDVADYRVLRG